MRQKILLLSEARHGTTYFIGNIRNSYRRSCEKVIACYEILSGAKHLISQAGTCLYACQNGMYYKNRKEFLDRLDDDDVIFQKTGTVAGDLLKVRRSSEQEYLRQFMQEVDNRKYGETFICKIFTSQIGLHGVGYPHTVEQVLDYFDKVIILDRDNLEYIFSHCNAMYFPSSKTPWAISEAKNKKVDITLTDKHILNYRYAVRKKEKIFNEAREYCKQNKKEFLDINYDDLDDWTKIEKFTGLELKGNKFKRHNYDYDSFLRNNPKLKSIL